MKQSENKKSLSEKNPVADFIFFRGIYCVPAEPHNLMREVSSKNAKKEVILW